MPSKDHCSLCDGTRKVSTLSHDETLLLGVIGEPLGDSMVCEPCWNAIVDAITATVANLRRTRIIAVEP